MCLVAVDGRQLVRRLRSTLIDVLALVVGFGLAAGVATQQGPCCSSAELAPAALQVLA